MGNEINKTVMRAMEDVIEKFKATIKKDKKMTNAEIRAKLGKVLEKYKFGILFGGGAGIVMDKLTEVIKNYKSEAEFIEKAKSILNDPKIRAVLVEKKQH